MVMQMIHAWIFLTRGGNSGSGSRDGHGSVFVTKMTFINNAWHLFDPQVLPCMLQMPCWWALSITALCMLAASPHVQAHYVSFQ